MSRFVRKFGLGYNKDPEELRTQKYSHELLGTEPAFPPAESLEEHECPLVNQGQSGSCTGHGTCQILACSSGAAGKPLPFVASPKGVYDGARCNERVRKSDGSFPALTDEGAGPADILVALGSDGIRAMLAPTPDGRNSDVWGPDDVGSSIHANVNDEPKLDELSAEALTIITGGYRIDETASSMLTQIKLAIAAGYAVGIGVFVDTNFMNFAAPWNPMTGINLDDPNGGGHWLCLNAYDATHSAGVEDDDIYSGPNSWGSWGAPPLTAAGPNQENGHYRVTGAWLKKALSNGGDVIIFKLDAVASKKAAA